MRLREPISSRRGARARHALVALSLVSSLLAMPAPADAAPPLAAAPATRASAARSDATVPALRTDTVALGEPVAAADAAPVQRSVLDVAATEAPTQTWQASGLDGFVAIGFSWDGPDGVEATLALTYADGTATGPIDLHQDSSHGEDTTVTARRISEPVALDRPAVSYSVTLPADVRDVSVHLIREDREHTIALDTAAPLQLATADGIPGPEGIRPRESWGARPRKPTEPCPPTSRPEGLGCVANSGVVNAVVHHTVNANNYSEASVPQLLRSIQAFHQDVDGYDDIGYNFVVDRFGTIWEARSGGTDRPVVGGHVRGFNTGSVGVAALGTFDAAAPTEATLDGISRVIAWKLAMRNVDPYGQVTVVSNGGDIYPEGVPVTIATIAGHGNIGATACPGAQLFARLPEIRQRVASLLPLFTGETDRSDRLTSSWVIGGFAMRRDSAGPVTVRLAVNGAVVGQMVANESRPDIGARFGGLGANHGFTFTIPMTRSADGIACVTEVSSGTLIGCRELNPVTPPFGDVEVFPQLNPPRLWVQGWIVDPDTSEPTVTHIYVDGVLTQIWADRERPDVQASYPYSGLHRGFSTDIPVSLGQHLVCAYAINTPRGVHPLLSCRYVVVGSVNRAAPIGAVDTIEGRGGSVLVSGWALDPDTTDAIDVHIYLLGVAHHVVASQPRPDVAAAIRGASTRTGYRAELAAPPGRHEVCVYAIDANTVGPNAKLGCRTITVT